MSRRHFSLGFVDGKWRIQDLQSSNRTIVNGKPISAPTDLTSGDRIQAGDTVIELTIGQEADEFKHSDIPADSAQALRRTDPAHAKSDDELRERSENAETWESE